MSIEWSSPVTINGNVAWALQTLLQRLSAFEVTEDNLKELETLNAVDNLIKPNDLRPLIGFRWGWGSRF